MAWSLHRAGLLTHDLDVAERFFGGLLGLGPARRDAGALWFGEGSRGLRVATQAPGLARGPAGLLGAVGARHLAVEVASLAAVVAGLSRAGIPHAEAAPGEFDLPAVWAMDPALNLVAFCQAEGAPVVAPRFGNGWHLHHVNLEAKAVRPAVEFYTALGGMVEGRWQAPAAMGDFSIDPNELAVLPLADDNSGLHIIRPDPGFAFRNGFAHNPSLGGHPAFCVPDVLAVKARLQAAGVLVSDAGVYAMKGMHQIYVLDPSANMIEVNQQV